MVRRLKAKYELWGLKTVLDKTEYIYIGGEVADVDIRERSIQCRLVFKYEHYFLIGSNWL